MKPFEIKPKVYWVGALHPDLRIFDIIMYTKNGTTYNSYLIDDEKVAIIDTVKAKFSERYISHVKELVDPERIEYVIIQHNEPDHSGALLDLLELAPHAKIVCANVAVKYVRNVINREFDIIGVKNGDTISLGQRTLQFISAPYLHWPDTMMTFVPEDKILFPCDVFSSHFCDSRMFNDAITRDFWPDFKYYFESIMRPFKKNLRNALKKIEALDFDLIAPSHGPILRTDLQKYIKAYEEWAQPLPPNDPKRVLIYYASAHGNTERMAQEIARGVRAEGAEVEVYDVIDLNFEGHLNKIEGADALLLGSPTINNDVAKPIWDVLNSLTTIDVKGKVGASFGSMGWNGEAIKLLDDRLSAMKFKVPFEGLSAVLVPSEEELAQCFEFGQKIARLLKE